MSDERKPLVFDLFCGLGGWSEAFISEGYRAIGFDIEKHDYGTGGYPGELVLRDVRSISGAELVNTYGVPAVIVAYPPCQEFSYMAMPWAKAKEKRRKILADPSERVRYIPIVIENVRGAQEWVGRSRWNFGSFHLWGDVPALMPMPAQLKIKTVGPSSPNQSDNFNCHINEMRDSLKGEGNKTVGMNWSDQSKRGQDFTRIAGKQVAEGTKLPGNNAPRRWEDREIKRLCDAVKVPSEQGRRTDVGKGARFTSRDCGAEGVKQFKDFHDSPIAALGSKTKARKQASAKIAKIPAPLAKWVSKVFKPVESIPV